MSKIVVIGGGIVGLSTAMLLAKDGHEVVVLERDPQPPAGSTEDAWSSWERRGVNQFRLPHFLLAGYRRIVDAELPEVALEVEAAGGLRTNPLLEIPEAIRGPEQPGDHDVEVLTARRPVFERAVALAAQSTDGLEVRRGVAVDGLLAEPGPDRVPKVLGVRTAEGDELRADLVVDLSGRRSSLPRLLAEVGAAAPYEEHDDSGFMYYARHYRSDDGSVPFAFGPPLAHVGTLTSVTLVADNGTWGLVLVTNSADRELLGLRDPARWESAFRALPLVAHWLDATPLDDAVTTMSKIEDRIRCLVVDGRPVATGVVAVGDAWSCSNPTHGRGVSIGALHALTLRQTLRDVGLDDPTAFAVAFHEATERDVRPWFEWTRRGDRHRLAEVDALIGGKPYEPEDPDFELERSLEAASSKDPELLRVQLRANLVVTPLAESLADPALRSRALELGKDWRSEQAPGPSREELVAIAGAR